MRIALVLLMSLGLMGCFGDDNEPKDGNGKVAKPEKVPDGVIPHIKQACEDCGKLDNMCCIGSCEAAGTQTNDQGCLGKLRCDKFPNGSRICRD